MSSDVISNLMFYMKYILFTVSIMIILGIVSMTGVQMIRWKSVILKYLGVLVGIKREKLIALSLILIRLLFFWSVILFSTELELTYIYYGILVTIIIHLLLADPRVLIFDILFTILIYGELYVVSLIKAFLNGIQMKGIVIAMEVVVITYILVTTLYCAIVCIRCIVKHNKKENRRLFLNILGQQGILLITGIFMVLIPYYYLNQIDTMTIMEDLYQYTAEGKINYIGENKVTKSGLGCVILNQDKMQELDDTPLYYANENKILLPGVISIIQPKLSLTNRIVNMSELYEKDGKYYVQNQKATTKVSDFFLYDGKDTYLFFEPITIYWEDQSIDLTPFSYIVVKYNQSIHVFNRESEAYSLIKTNLCNVTTTMDCGVTINLSADIISRENGQEQMLFLQPNLLEDLK